MAPRILNRGFVPTLLILLAVLEVLLRLAPAAGASTYRSLYGNSLSVYQELTRRLEAHAPGVQVLGLGDSLAMTQFQPDVLAQTQGLAASAVFNAAYLGMSFPSQERMIRHVGLDRLDALDHVLLFLNPRRLSAAEVPNTDVFRVVVPEPDGPWREMWETKKIGPLLDYSRLYGLSRYLVLEGWEALLAPAAPSWDQIETLQATGGSSWEHPRPTAEAPHYPYATLDQVSPERLAEFERLVALFRNRGIAVTIVASAVHPAVDPYASPGAQDALERAVTDVARRHGASVRLEAPRATIADRDFCDYGHTNKRGGDAYTGALGQWLASRDGS